MVHADQFDSIAKFGTRYETTSPEIWDQAGQNPIAFTYATDTDVTLARAGKSLKLKGRAVLGIAYAERVGLKESTASSLSWSELGAGLRHCEHPDPRAALWQDRCNSERPQAVHGEVTERWQLDVQYTALDRWKERAVLDWDVREYFSFVASDEAGRPLVK